MQTFVRHVKMESSQKTYTGTSPVCERMELIMAAKKTVKAEKAAAPVNDVREEKLKAMEHEMVLPEIDVTQTYKSIEEGVVGTYEKIEDAFVSGYRKIEEGTVTGFHKITDKFVKKLFSREGETVEETKDRLRRK